MTAVKRPLLTALALAVLLVPQAACLWSLRPLYEDYNDPDIVFEPALLGEWAMSSKEGALVVVVKKSESPPDVVSADGKNSYDITVKGVTSESSPLHFRGRLVRLADFLFLDLVAHEDSMQKAPSLGLLSTHMFYRIRLSGDALEAESVNERFLDILHEPFLRYERTEIFSPTLLTAHPRDIKQRLKKHHSDPSICDEPLQLRRVK